MNRKELVVSGTIIGGTFAITGLMVNSFKQTAKFRHNYPEIHTQEEIRTLYQEHEDFSDPISSWGPEELAGASICLALVVWVIMAGSSLLLQFEKQKE